jgi:polyhydroxyalkanoate synthase
MFQMLDALRRQRGALLDAVGWGPQESAYRIIAEQPGMRVRAYQGPGGEAPQPGPALLIVQAPFKRCYIWDLHPDVSVVRRCRKSGLQVFLLEWREPAPGEDFGLADYAEAFPLAAVGAICAASAPGSVTVAGHSLGGTFAAIFAALHPERVRDLWLIDAPVVFAAAAGDRLAATLQWMDLGWFAGAAGDPVAGSLINALAAAALPDEFLWRPAADLLASSWDANRRRLHAQVLRWTLDEFPLPRRLFMDVAEQLYRQDCFHKGTLRIRSKSVGLADLRTSIAAVLNPASAVVPAALVEEGLRLARAPSVRIISYEPDAGCAIQHVGPLVSPRAHAHIWPELIQRAWSG